MRGYYYFFFNSIDLDPKICFNFGPIDHGSTLTSESE